MFWAKKKNKKKKKKKKKNSMKFSIFASEKILCILHGESFRNGVIVESDI